MVVKAACWGKKLLAIKIVVRVVMMFLEMMGGYDRGGEGRLRVWFIVVVVWLEGEVFGCLQTKIDSLHSSNKT